MPSRLWGWAKAAVVLEVFVWTALYRWVLRRPDVPRDATPVPYAREVTPLMGLWIFASAAEVPVAHVLVPWEPVRLALLVVGVWGLLWMLGMLGGLRSYPHLLTDRALRVRSVPRCDVAVPWEAVAGAVLRAQDLPSTMRTLQLEGSDLRIGVSGRTNTTVRLTGPTPLQTRRGELVVDSVSLWVDEPREFVAQVRERVGARTG